ncbi:TPA: hypothetical protein ACRZ6V_001253 [Vibrio harveyi]
MTTTFNINTVTLKDIFTTYPTKKIKALLSSMPVHQVQSILVNSIDTSHLIHGSERDKDALNKLASLTKQINEEVLCIHEKGYSAFFTDTTHLPKMSDYDSLCKWLYELRSMLEASAPDTKVLSAYEWLPYLDTISNDIREYLKVITGSIERDALHHSNYQVHSQKTTSYQAMTAIKGSIEVEAEARKAIEDVIKLCKYDSKNVTCHIPELPSYLPETIAMQYRPMIRSICNELSKVLVQDSASLGILLDDVTRRAIMLVASDMQYAKEINSVELKTISLNLARISDYEMQAQALIDAQEQEEEDDLAFKKELESMQRVLELEKKIVEGTCSPAELAEYKKLK